MNKLILKKWSYNLIPLFVWVLLLLLPFISAPSNMNAAIHRRIFQHILISNLLLLVIFYLHSYIIYPLLKQKGLLWYLAGLFMILLLFGLQQVFLQPALPPLHMGSLHNNGNPNPSFGPPMARPGNFMAILSLLITILCSFCYRVITDHTAREKLLQERETVHLRTELNFLRSQINPHFLFNTLNNLTSLARKKSDMLEPAIINLSQLMRYMLYESNDNKVSLKNEINYLNSYINLQLLRFGNELTVSTKFNGNYEACQIDPMLLIPLVENAFKYGTNVSDHNLISITLDVSDDGKILHFKLLNYFNEMDETAHEKTGIGLKNIQRRLDILYPNKHSFKTAGIGGLYTTELTIDLS